MLKVGVSLRIFSVQYNIFPFIMSFQLKLFIGSKIKFIFAIYFFLFFFNQKQMVPLTVSKQVAHYVFQN